MKSVIYITFFLPIFLQAITLSLTLVNPLLYEEQRKIYEEQQKKRQTTASIYTELKSIPLSQDDDSSQACIQIESIEIQNVTRIGKKVLDANYGEKEHSRMEYYRDNFTVKDENGKERMTIDTGLLPLSSTVDINTGPKSIIDITGGK